MRVRPVIYIVPLALLLLAIVGGSPLVMRLFFASLAVLAIGYIWAMLGLRGVKVGIGELPEHCQVGDRLDQQITIDNESGIPKLFLRAEQDTSFPGHEKVRLLNLGPGARHLWASDINCTRRGRYALGSVTLSAGDPFGLFTRRRSVGSTRSVIVYPRPVDLPYFRSSLSSLTDFGRSTAARRISQIAPSASGVREIMSGDSLEHIHWRSTAHTGRLMVKTFDADRASEAGSKTAWVALDMAQTTALGEGEDTAEEYGVTIATSIIKKYLDSGMRSGLIAAADQLYTFAPDTGAHHLSAMLEALAVMKAAGTTPIDELISRNISRLSGDATVIIVTPQANDMLLDSVHRLKAYGASVVAVLLDATSFGGTLDPSFVAFGLGSAGAQVYVVRKGDSLARALDSRAAQWYSRFV